MAEADMDNADINKRIGNEGLIPCAVLVPLSKYPSIPVDVDGQRTEKGKQKSLPDDDEEQEYRMHLGTVPGDMANKFSLEQTKSTHISLTKLVKRFLESLKIKHDLLNEKSFSYTNQWGVEFYGCFLITCTRKLASGLGALFGMAFRQDAVGIFSCFTKDEDDIHGFFLVSRSSGSPMKTSEALKIMKLIHPRFPDLSAQRDPMNTAVELHDYDNNHSSTTSDAVLEPILDKPFNHLSYQVDKYGAKSFLVDKDHYEEAIENAGLQSYKILIEMTQLHAKSYPVTPNN